MKGSLGIGLAGLLAMVGCSKPAPAPAPVTSTSTANTANTASGADALAILEKNQETMYALKAYSANCLTDISFQQPEPKLAYGVSILSAEKPMKMRYDSWEVKALPTGKIERPKAVPDVTLACETVDLYGQFGDKYRIKKGIAAEDLRTIQEPWDGFFSTKTSLAAGFDASKEQGTAEISLAGTAEVDGVACDKVLIHSTRTVEDRQVDEKATYFIGHDDHLVRREVSEVMINGQPGFTRTANLRDIKMEPAKDPGIYAYKAPTGVTFDKPTDETRPPALLTSGTKAPAFAVSGVDKKKVTLASLRGKVVVLDFWASWCGPCQASMPHTQDVAKKLADEGLPVVVLAVDDGEPWDAFQRWIDGNKEKYPNMTFASTADLSPNMSHKLFNVSGIPTQYIIDKNGVIRTSFVGYRGPTDDLENAIRDALNG